MIRRFTWDMTEKKMVKHSYTVPCSSAFRDAVTALAEKRGVNVADLARSILLVVPGDVVDAFEDPGEPDPDDREEVAIKSGPSEGRPWRRKPRIQVRLTPGYDVTMIRKALNLALAVEHGVINMDVQGLSLPGRAEPAQQAREAEKKIPEPTHPPHIDTEPIERHHALIREREEEVERLRTIVSVLSFEPLPNGVSSRAEALHVLGFPPNAAPDRSSVKGRFRMLATIHHPDAAYGSHERMSQLNAAMDYLR